MSKFTNVMLSAAACLLLSSLGAEDLNDPVLAARKDKYKSASHNTEMKPGQEMEKRFSGMVQGSYTYWQVQQIGLNQIHTNNYGTPPAQNAGTKGTTYRPRIKNQSGFKVAAALMDHEMHWCYCADYTWFRNQDQYTRSLVFSDSNATDVWSTVRTNFAQNQWNNTFQRVNGNLCACIMPFKSFSVSPFIGLAGAWEDQNLRVFSAPVEDVDSSFALTTYFQDWWAIGPRVGSCGKFHAYKGECCEFNFFGRAAMAQVYEKTKWTCKSDTNATPRTNLMWTGQTIYNTNLAFDTMLGAGFEYKFGKVYAQSVFVNVSWELQVWPEHNRFASVSSKVQGLGPLSFQGLTVDAGVCF